MTHLADYSLPQLKQLQTHISKEIEKRESNTKASLLKRLRKLAQEEGISLEDLLGRTMETTASATKRGRPAAKTVSAKKPWPNRRPTSRRLSAPSSIRSSGSTAHPKMPIWKHPLSTTVWKKRKQFLSAGPKLKAKAM